MNINRKLIAGVSFVVDIIAVGIPGDGAIFIFSIGFITFCIFNIGQICFINQIVSAIAVF